MAEDDKVVSGVRDVDTLLQILDHLPTSIFVKNEQLQFEFSNAAHCHIIGVAADKLIGFSDQDFYPAEEAAGFLARDRAVLDGGETVEVEEDCTSQTGITTPHLTRKSKFTAHDGKVYLIGTNTNIAELRKREEQYRALAQTVPVGVWQVDETGHTSFANPRFLAYLGIDVDALRDADIGKMLGGAREDFPGTACRFETDIAGTSGAARRVLVISSGWLLLTADGLRSAIVSLVDISEMTELKRVNDEISRLNRELADHVGKLKDAQDEILRRGRMAQLGQLTATVAHEIRNPLGAVRTASYLIERKLKDKGSGLEPQLKRISNGITRCDDIITQLLDFSRAKAPNLAPVVVDEWLGRIVSEEAEKLPSAVEIELQLGLGDLTANIDAARMMRVMINLLSNASEAMVGRGDDSENFATAHPRIWVKSRLAARGIEIEVIDNGPGMSEDIQKKILEPLFTTKNFGTGLGLPAADKILQEHGGGIAIRSAPGQGASFTAWFPANAALKAAS